ncbi:hypothetical protein, partial [Streptomyces laculatispora]|uniref:hypothetical protein n=1 Tax=Streptomyces laculatispora TaxID=887464 RepID=UPI001A943247
MFAVESWRVTVEQCSGEPVTEAGRVVAPEAEPLAEPALSPRQLRQGGSRPPRGPLGPGSPAAGAGLE